MHQVVRSATKETLGNGLVTSRAYDGVTHWLSSVESGPGGGATIQNQSFLYDEVGNVSQRQDNNHGLSENFYYDDDNRLSYSTLNGTQNLGLTYNAMGNITSRSDVAGGASWTYDPVHLHQVTQAGSSAYQYGYDANGNVTSRQGSSISWSSYNYPTAINDTATGETVSFLYGPDRRAYFEQTQSSSGTETNYHIGGLLDIVTSGGVTDYRHYIYAGGEPVAIDSRKSSGAKTLYYLLSDHQGSIAAITNSAGTVVVGESFTAYGSRRNPTTWSGAPVSGDLTTIAGITRQGYTFQDVLGQMGLNDMVGRVQDAVTGRFLSADPMIADGTDPQSYNRYGYTINNPLTYTDPTGFLISEQDLEADYWQTIYVASDFVTSLLNFTDSKEAQTGTVTSAGATQDLFLGGYTPGDWSNLIGSWNLNQDNTWTWESSGLLDEGTGLAGVGLVGSDTLQLGDLQSLVEARDHFPLDGGRPATPAIPTAATDAQQGKSRSSQCPRPDLSLSRPSYLQRVNADASAANQALGTGVTKAGTALASGALSRGVFGTSGVTPFQTWFEGAGPISTDFGVLSGLSRVGGALVVRVGAGMAVYSAWRVGNYVGAAVGNISLPGGPTITDAVSDFIQVEAEGPDVSEFSCTP